MFDRSCTRRKWLLAIAAGALATFTAPQSGYAQGTWTTLAPVPSPTEGMTVGGVGNVNIGAYGSSGGDTNLTRLYGSTTDSWSSGALGLGSARSEAADGDTTHAGFLYVIGGESAGVVQADLQRYDLVMNTWTTLAPMPTARAGAAAAAVDNNIFVIGGRLSAPGACGGGPYLATVEKYDVDTNTWSAVAPLPSARSDLAAVAHGGKIFVFGGCAGPVTSEVDMYDPQTNTWTTGLAPMPTPRASLAVGHSGQSVYAIGGWNGSALSVNEVYNIAGNSWSTNTPMPTARLEAGTRSHGGRIYVVGGATAPGIPTSAHEVFKP
jgi:hypothetical protein